MPLLTDYTIFLSKQIRKSIVAARYSLLRFVFNFNIKHLKKGSVNKKLANLKVIG